MPPPWQDLNHPEPSMTVAHWTTAGESGVTETAMGPLVTHGGTWPGWVSKTARYPQRDIAVAVMSDGTDEKTISQLGITLAERAAAP